jgi:hypothetical protein
VRASYTPGWLQELEASLRGLTEAASEAVEIEWGLRQIIYERE